MPPSQGLWTKGVMHADVSYVTDRGASQLLCTTADYVESVLWQEVRCSSPEGHDAPPPPRLWPAAGPSCDTANKRGSPNIELMRGQSRRRRASFNTVLQQGLVFNGNCPPLSSLSIIMTIMFIATANTGRFHRYWPSINTYLNVLLFKFPPAWSCVSLPRPTTPSEWKLLIVV